jgi:hypothetical protein
MAHVARQHAERAHARAQLQYASLLRSMNETRLRYMHACAAIDRTSGEWPMRVLSRVAMTVCDDTGALVTVRELIHDFPRVVVQFLR